MVESFYHAITLGPTACCSCFVDVKKLTDLLEQLTIEFGALISMQLAWDTKSTNELFHDECDMVVSSGSSW